MDVEIKLGCWALCDFEFGVKGYGVGPVVAVVYDASGCGASDESDVFWCGALCGCQFLSVAERTGR